MKQVFNIWANKLREAKLLWNVIQFIRSWAVIWGQVCDSKPMTFDTILREQVYT